MLCYKETFFNVTKNFFCLFVETKDIYKGDWKNDLKHGEGVYFSRTLGTELVGVWQGDLPRCGTFEVVNPDIATSPMKCEIPPVRQV